MKEHLIPEEARDRIRACVEREDTDKFTTCKEVSDLWSELKLGIIDKKKKSEGWGDKEAEGKAHRWFLSSLAADAGLGYQSMLNRQRVGDSVIARGYYGGENENISYQKWVCLHANAESGEDGLITREELEKRIAWFHDVTDCNAGQPPSVFDIQQQYRKNGKDKEWEQDWKSIIRIAERMLKNEVPDLLREILEYILSNADVDFTGGLTGTQEAVSTATTPQKFGVPTVIYKGSGWTGAQKETR